MKPRILIADNEVTICKGLARALSDKYRTYMAFNGAEALDIISQTGNIDIVLCDIMMPVMNGIELYNKALKTYPNLQRRFIFYTGSVQDEHLEFFHNNNVRYLEKPLIIERLEQTIDEVLKSTSTHRNARVIIYDDDAQILHALERWLFEAGYEVITFNEPLVCPVYEKNSDDCNIEKLCADIILTDFNMPKMNGIELLQKQSQRGCKVDKRNKAILSGYIDEEHKKEIQKLNYSIFGKPVELSKLSFWLSECIKRVDLSIPLINLSNV